ncbi:MAG TPA: response regulator [Gemmatimonadales bacterium]|nr:response regulator [Gemmatimonadales bacterium]
MSVPFPSLGATILVVDDERVARRLLYRVLTEDGYRVFEAASAEEAMAVLELAHCYVHLIMLDVVMPEVDGVELGRRILTRWPSLRLLYMSAYPAEILVQRGLADPQVHFLAKPFTHDELMSKVEVASDRRLTPKNERAEGVRGHGIDWA